MPVVECHPVCSLLVLFVGSPKPSTLKRMPSFPKVAGATGEGSFCVQMGCDRFLSSQAKPPEKWLECKWATAH